MLADKYGRKWLLVLNIVQLQLRGCWMYLVRECRTSLPHNVIAILTSTPAVSFPDFFPIRLLWLEAVLGVLGGGSMVATALLFVIVSDVTPSSQTSVDYAPHLQLCTDYFRPVAPVLSSASAQRISFAFLLHHLWLQS